MLQIGFIRIKFCFISFCAAAASASTAGVALRLAFLLQLNLTAVNHALHTLHLALKFKFYANFTQNDQRDSGAWHEDGGVVRAGGEGEGERLSRRQSRLCQQKRVKCVKY